LESIYEKDGTKKTIKPLNKNLYALIMENVLAWRTTKNGVGVRWLKIKEDALDFFCKI